MLEFTGERYIPDLKEAQISYEHWHRYLYASYFVKDKVVLDIACGEGYGSDFLSNKVFLVCLRVATLSMFTYTQPHVEKYTP